MTLLVLLGALVPFAARADEIPVPAEQLPAPAQEFVKAHFASQKVALVMFDKGWVKSVYEVTLSDGTEIDFSDKGEWLEIEMKGRKGMPASLLPEPIQKFLQEKHKEAKIEEAAKKRYGYKVELYGDVEIRFDKEGKFLGYDD